MSWNVPDLPTGDKAPPNVIQEAIRHPAHGQRSDGSPPRWRPSPGGMTADQATESRPRPGLVPARNHLVIAVAYRRPSAPVGPPVLGDRAPGSGAGPEAEDLPERAEPGVADHGAAQGEHADQPAGDLV